MKTHKVLKAALTEVAEAASWYDEEGAPGLGSELIAEYETRLEAALRMPGAGVVVATTANGTPVRRYRLRRFNRYAILIAEIDAHPTVLAFECSSRRPRYWQDRVKTEKSSRES